MEQTSWTLVEGGPKNPRKQLNVSGCVSDRSRNRRVPWPKCPPEALFERISPPKRASELCPCRPRKSRLRTTINIHGSEVFHGAAGRSRALVIIAGFREQPVGMHPADCGRLF